MKLLFLLVPVLLSGQMFPGPGGNVTSASGVNGYTHCSPLVTSHTMVSGTDDHVVPIVKTIVGLKSTGNGGYVTDAQGDDINFFSDSGATTMLNWDPLESWNSSTGAIVAWVKIASLSPSVDQTIYVCYGKASVTTFQGGSAGAAWDSNMRGAWHLEDNAASTTVLNRTSVSANGTNQVNTSTVTITGKVGLGLNYPATTDYTTTTDAGFTGTRTWTVCAWINATWAASALIMRNDTAAEDSAFQVDSTGHLVIHYGSTVLTGSTAMSNTTWYHACLVSLNGTGSGLYLNGSSDGTVGSTGIWNTNASYFGGDAFSQNLGKLDELRLSNTNRSANWISTEYQTQNDPASFITVGTEF